MPSSASEEDAYGLKESGEALRQRRVELLPFRHDSDLDGRLSRDRSNLVVGFSLRPLNYPAEEASDDRTDDEAQRSPTDIILHRRYPRQGRQDAPESSRDHLAGFERC